MTRAVMISSVIKEFIGSSNSSPFCSTPRSLRPFFPMDSFGSVLSSNVFIVDHRGTPRLLFFFWLNNSLSQCLLQLRVVLAFITKTQILVLFLSYLYLAMSLSHNPHHQAPFSRKSLPPRLDLTQDLKTRLAQLFRAENTRE